MQYHEMTRRDPLEIGVLQKVHLDQWFETILAAELRMISVPFEMAIVHFPGCITMSQSIPLSIMSVSANLS